MGVIKLIKDFEEYKIYRSKRLDENITSSQLEKLTAAMREFEEANTEIFDKLLWEKWNTPLSSLIIID